MTEAMRIVTDVNGRIVEVGAGTADLLSTDWHELRGRGLETFVAREQTLEFRRLLHDLVRGNGPVGASLRLERADGGVGIEVEAIAEADGQRVEWLLAPPLEPDDDHHPDPLLLERLPLRRLLARLPIGVISLDERLTVDYANPAARIFLAGIRTGELLPDSLPSFSLRKFAQRLFTSTLPVRQLVEASTGRLLEVDGIAGSHHESALVLIQDVTTRERRRRAEQEFAANAAHELRTPIAAIVGALEVLQSGAKESPRDRDLFLGHLERESARLGRLVAALLLLARVEMGQEQPVLDILELEPLLRNIADDLDPREGVFVRVDCATDLTVFSDADLLHQAVWNLASNAGKHTDTGEIVLAARRLGAVAEIEVRDTGSGIEPADRAHIFDRFFRARRRAGGVGLGLPIAQEITRALGGTLTVDSEPGVGTSAYVRVPGARVVA